jgi:hypothetical protein
LTRLEVEAEKKYSRVLPSLVVDLKLPLIVGKSRVEHLSLIEHLMVEAEDSLILCERSIFIFGRTHWEGEVRFFLDGGPMLM